MSDIRTVSNTPSTAAGYTGVGEWFGAGLEGEGGGGVAPAVPLSVHCADAHTPAGETRLQLVYSWSPVGAV